MNLALADGIRKIQKFVLLLEIMVDTPGTIKWTFVKTFSNADIT